MAHKKQARTSARPTRAKKKKARASPADKDERLKPISLRGYSFEQVIDVLLGKGKRPS
jgi:hypothetical protein